MSKRTLLALTVVVAVAIVGGILLWNRPAANPSPAEFKSAEGKTKFAGRVKANAWLGEPMAFSSVQQVKVNDTDRLEFAFTSAKTGKFVRILLARDQGQWRVDRLSF